VNALTICQPYPVLILDGRKPIENRTWPTRFRGWFAIHAGKSREWLSGDEERIYGIRESDMVFGAIVGVAKLVACLDINKPETWGEWSYLKWHEHANGPWCWVLEDVRKLREPIPYRGAQGLWPVPEPIVEQMREQLRRSAA
jgi:activating signal cointegrator 1